jgi:Tfp pilus assembly protein PilO
MALDWQQQYQKSRRYFIGLRYLRTNRRAKVYTGLTLSFFAIAFFSFFAIRPTAVTITSLLKELEEKRVIDQKLQTKIKTLSTANVNYSAVSNSLKLLDDALPPEASLPQIIYQLEYLVQQGNLTILSLAFDPVSVLGKNLEPNTAEAKAAQPQQLNFSITVYGNFDDSTSFLKKMESLRRILVIHSFSFTGRQSEKTVNLSLSGAIFYLPVPETK